MDKTITKIKIRELEKHLRYIEKSAATGEKCRRCWSRPFAPAGIWASELEYITVINKESFIDFHKHLNNNLCLDIEENYFRMTEYEAIILKVSRCKTVIDFQRLNVEKRNEYLKSCRDKGISIRQLCRLTELSF